MNIVYNLNIELEIEKRLLHRLHRQKKILEERQAPAGYPGGMSYIDADSIHGRGTMSFLDVIEQLDRIDQYIVDQEKKVKLIEQELKQITNLIRSLTGLGQKVKYMQLIEGKSLREIAIETGYSYDHIRRVSSRMPQ